MANAKELTFTTELLSAGKTATGFVIPDEIVEKLGAGKKPAVKVTINGYTYRNTIATMGGKFMLGVSAEHRGNSGVKAGDKLKVQLELDTEPREVTVPPDLKKALDKNAKAKKIFESLSYSKKRVHTLSVEGAKTEETRIKRVEKAITLLLAEQK